MPNHAREAFSQETSVARSSRNVSIVSSSVCDSKRNSRALVIIDILSCVCERGSRRAFDSWAISYPMASGLDQVSSLRDPGPPRDASGDRRHRLDQLADRRGLVQQVALREVD